MTPLEYQILLQNIINVEVVNHFFFQLCVQYHNILFVIFVTERYFIAFNCLTTHITLRKLLTFQKFVLNRLYLKPYHISYIKIVIQTAELLRKVDFDDLFGFFLCPTDLVKKVLH